jgi:MATE family multidrug resistance protein
MFKFSDKQGGIKQMLAIALPMVASQSCDTAMIFTGRLFLSKLNPEFMNAAMGGGLTVFMMMSFFIGLTGYSSALVAQYLGAGRKQDCAKVITQAAIISFIAYIPILACAPLAHRMFEAMGVSPDQLGPQKIYFNIMLYGVLISLLRTCLSSFFSGIGKTRVIMVASLTAMLVNAACGYILIFGKFGVPALGIAGAAYATILGGASGLLVLGIAYFAPRYWKEFSLATSFKFDFDVIRKLLHFGSPTGLELFLTIMAFNGMVLIFHSHGLVTATAATIMLNWDLVSFVPLVGLEIAVTSLVGRFMGAGRPDIAHRAVMAGLKIGCVYSAVIFILFVGFPQALIGVFSPTAPSDVFSQAFPTALFMLRVASLYVLVEAMLIVLIGALRGAGDTFWAMGISVAIHWLMVGGLFIALRVLHVSPEAGWAFVVALFLLFFFLVYLRYRSGQWRSIKVVEQGPTPFVPESLHPPTDI